MVKNSQVFCTQNIQTDIIQQAALVSVRRAEQVDWPILARMLVGSC